MIDGGFREQIFAAEYFSRQDFPANEYEIIWVEFYKKAHPELEKYPGIKVKTLNNDGVYHSSYCFNHGINEAKADILVIPDADVMVEDNFLSTVYEGHCRNHELVMYFYRQCQEKEFFKKDDFSFEYIKQTSIMSKPDNYGGCLTVRKKWLLEIGGYEQHESFATGDHANGKDVYTRLRNLGLYVKWHPRKFLYHPWHPGTCGDGADKDRYKRQLRIIDYRGKHLITKPFNGIDGTCLPHSLPPGLREPKT